MTINSSDVKRYIVPKNQAWYEISDKQPVLKSEQVMVLASDYDALKTERDALAAHLERFRTAWRQYEDSEYWSDDEIKAEEQLSALMEEDPATSLIHLKARWQVEALLDLHEHWRGNGTMRVGALLDKAIELQEEAEGGET